MANLLGVPSYDPTLDQQNARSQAELLQGLGRQIRSDITAIQTDRQLKGLSQGLQQVNPDSNDFGKSVIGLMQQYPLATQSPLGQAAINQLGAQHKFWQQEQLRQRDPWRVSGGTAYNAATGETKTIPRAETSRDFQPVRGANGKTLGFVNPATQEVINPADMGLNEPALPARKDVRVINGTAIDFNDPSGKPVEVYKSTGTPKADRPAFRNEERYNNLQPYVKGLDEVRAKLKASGLNPEAAHADIERKLGPAGKELSAQRKFFQDALTTDTSTWRDSENFVRTFEKRYPGGAVEAVSVAPAGANGVQVDTTAVLPDGPEALIPTMPVQPTSPRRRSFNPVSGLLE